MRLFVDGSVGVQATNFGAKSVPRFLNVGHPVLNNRNLGFRESPNDGCRNGIVDGIEDGSLLGFELGFVEGSADDCDNGWRDGIDGGF